MATALYQEFEADTGFKGDTNVFDGTVTLTGGITGGTLKLVSGPGGTNVGTTWTTGPPAFTTGQAYISVTAGSTTYKVPVFA
jgi:hypothetical protein